MNTMDYKIIKLIKILEKQKWKAIEFETNGYVTIKFILHKPQYRFLKSEEKIQISDTITNKKVIIDIYTSREIEINEKLQQYEIMLDNNQYIKLKIY